eukprot:1398410-Rhodomonas_salina.1
MNASLKRFRGHPYSYLQGFSLIPMAIQQVFTYSVSVTGWTMDTLQPVHDMWGLMGKLAWDLTEGHHSALFLTPDVEGRIAQASPYHLAPKHSLSFLQSICEGLQNDILLLVQAEWQRLCTLWGTQWPQEIQAALLLLDSVDSSHTLLFQVLYYLGHAGIVLAWEHLPNLVRPAPYPEDSDKLDRPLIGALWDYVWYCLSIRWEMCKGSASNHTLANGIASLVRQGICTPLQLWSVLGNGWRIHATLTHNELNTILLALEHSFPQTSRYSVLADLQCSRQGPQIIPDNSASPPAPSTPPSRQLRQVSEIVDLHTPPRTAEPLGHSAEMLLWAGSIKGYDPTNRLYTIVLPTGRDLATRAAELNE